MPKPNPLIVVLSNGRSGSSMVCGLIAAHGVYTGPVKAGDKRNPKGFFENSAIYKLAAKHGALKSYNRVGKPDAEWEQEFINLVTEQGYKKGPMVVKHSPNNWKMWEPFDPIFVTVRRPVWAQMKSRQVSGHGSKGINYIEWGERCMDALEADNKAARIDSDQIIKEDYSALNKILKKVNIDLDEKICNDFVEPEYWHYKNK